MCQEFPDPFELFFPEPPHLRLAGRSVLSSSAVPTLSEGEIDYRLDALFENPAKQMLELMPEDLLTFNRLTYLPRS